MNQESLETVDWNKNNFQTNQNEYGKFKFLKYHKGPKLIDVTKVYLVIGSIGPIRFTSATFLPSGTNFVPVNILTTPC
jgi:hypothetical protein